LTLLKIYSEPISQELVFANALDGEKSWLLINNLISPDWIR